MTTFPTGSRLSRSLLVPALAGLLTACGSDDGGTDPMASGGAGATAGQSAGGSSQGGASTGGAGGAMVPDGPTPPLPSATGTCPTFANGMATFTVNGEAREAKIWIDEAAAAASDGPLVFYWYGTGGQPDQVETGMAASVAPGLGPDGIARITAAGGIVVAPVALQIGTFPWIEAAGADYPLADEIVACAEQEVGIDDRHIHSLGFSAGALHTTNFGYERSSYIASVVTYSGGGTPFTVQDPSNKFPALIFYGGAGDQVIIMFQQQSQDYYDALTGDGHFAAICDHGGGHRIPDAGPAAAVQFFFDHPFGTSPSPYAGGLPADFPSYCTL